MLGVSLIKEEKRMEVKAGRRDIYTRVTAISWFNLFCWSTNTKRPSDNLAQPPATSLIRILETRVGTRSEHSIRIEALL
jgi:hypothetical protein